MVESKHLLDVVQVRVSAKSARLGFHGCTEDYIRNVCHGRCCTTSMPTGALVVVDDAEATALRVRMGRDVVHGHLIDVTRDRRCPFHEASGLCAIHATDKPTGCHESPFTLNDRDTLIVRNRWKRLVCFKDGAPPLPAYLAFRSALDSLFGKEEAVRIVAHLDAGGGDLVAWMPVVNYLRVRAKSKILRAAIAKGRKPRYLKKAPKLGP